MNYEHGVPCSPGCEHHVGHPCENCGRYAAGLATGPDVVAAYSYVMLTLAEKSPLVYSKIMQGTANKWTLDQMLFAIIIEQHDAIEKLTERLERSIVLSYTRQ